MRLIDACELKHVIHNSNLSGNREWLLMELDKIIDNAKTVKSFTLEDIDYSSERQTAFCPNCGADMRGAE